MGEQGEKVRPLGKPRANEHLEKLSCRETPGS